MKWYVIAGGALVLIWLGTTSFAPLVVGILIGGLIYQIVKPGGSQAGNLVQNAGSAVKGVVA